MDRFPPPWRRPPRRPSRRSARSKLVHPSRQLDGSPSDEAWDRCDLGASRLVTLTVPFRDTAAASPPLLMAPAPCPVGITSGATRVARYARESAERASASSGFPPPAG